MVAEFSEKENVAKLDDVAQVYGILPKEKTDIEDIWDYLLKIEEGAKDKNEREKAQRIKLPNRPCALVPLADQHFGGKSNYSQLRADAEIIAVTPDMYAINAGDTVDNFIIGKLANIQKEQPTTFEQELRAAIWWVETIAPKLLVWISGNHESWTRKLSGIDFWRSKLRNCACLYDPHQCVFEVEHNGHCTTWCVRHKWRGSSIFNPTHGLEVGWERMGIDYDIAIGGHTHIATLHREFVKHGRKRDAILLGTYKLRDEYGKDLGFAESYGESGSGAMIMLPDGRRFWTDCLDTAADMLDYWRSKF